MVLEIWDLRDLVFSPKTVFSMGFERQISCHSECISVIKNCTSGVFLTENSISKSVSPRDFPMLCDNVSNMRFRHFRDFGLGILKLKKLDF